MAAQTLKEWREQVLNGLLYGSLILGTLMLSVGAATTLRDKRPDLLLIYLSAYGILIFIGLRSQLGFIMGVFFCLHLSSLLLFVLT